MVRIMYDSININKIPVTTDLAAVYFNGIYATTDRAFINRFGSLDKRILIDVNGNAEGCHVLDVENGDATPAKARKWIADKDERGETGTIYCSRDTIPAVWNACQGLSYHLWVATLDGTTVWKGHELSDIGGVAAVQQYGAAQLGFNADKSIVYNPYWPLEEPVKPPVPAPPGPVRLVSLSARFSDGSVVTFS